MPLTFIDLFCGLGGSTYGLEQAGLRSVGALDWNEQAIATYRANFPHSEAVVGSIADPHVQKAMVDKFKDRIDMVTGSPSCQGFSTMNGGNGRIDDPRNDLVSIFAQVAVQFNARYIMLEEVANVLTLDGGRHFAEYKRILQASGYRFPDTKERDYILWATHYGSPQRRKRLIVVATRADTPPITWPPPRSHDKPVTVREVLQGMLPADLDPDNKLLTPFSEHTRMNIEARARGEVVASGQFAGNLGIIDLDAPCRTITTKCFSPTCGTFTLRDPVTGVLRRLTVREAAVLQGFRDMKITRSAGGGATSTTVAGLQIGNAVPAEFGRAIGMHILAHNAQL